VAEKCCGVGGSQARPVHDQGQRVTDGVDMHRPPSPRGTRDR
jgi:hypothetical protein